MGGNRHNNKADMSITEQLYAIRLKCCDICKYKEAMENGSLTYPEETTTADDYLGEHYCKNCFIGGI